MKEFQDRLLRQTSANLGVPYAVFARDVEAPYISRARLELQRRFAELDAWRRANEQRLYLQLILPIFIEMRSVEIAAAYRLEQAAVLELYDRFL